ncbi:MAG: hypothetical protein L6Q81_17060 [Bacteroidia bacterium]|nr:hypothetical protein [Bacteroidia bacterium]
MHFPRISVIAVFLVLFACQMNAQVSVNSGTSRVNATDSISEFMLRGAVMSLAAVQSKYESLEAAGSGNQILSRQKSGEAQNYFNQSRTYYRKALQYDSLYAPAWNSLGTTYFLQDIPDQSLPYYHRAIALKPDYTVAIINIGKAYSKMGQQDSALFYFRQSVKVDSSFVQGYIEQARVLTDYKHDYNGALTVLQTACSYTKQNEVPYIMMSEIHFMKGDSVSAMTALETAARFNPGNVDRCLMLASWYERHGDADKAKEFRALADKERNRVAPREKDHESAK